MSKATIVGAIAVVAVFAGVWWYAGGREASAPTEPHATLASGNAEPVPAPGPQPQSTSRSDPAGRPALPADPRLAALMVTPDNGQIEFAKGADGRVIQEIDKDPNSLGFRKPLREYTYSGDKVVGLTAYRYLPEQVEITRIAVSYKPDGSIDQYRDSTSYEQKGQSKSGD